MKKLLIIAVFAVFSASSAISASLTPIVGVSYNNAAYAGEGIEKNFNETGTLKTTTEEYGAFSDQFASVFVELEINDIIAVGVDYVPGTIATPENISREGTSGASLLNPGRSTVSVDFEKLTTVYARLNVPFLGGAYLKAGFSQVDVIINENMESGNTYKDVDTEGMVAGIGYDHDLANGISIRAEVTASNFDDVQSNNGVASGGNMNQVFVESMWGARGTVSLVKSF
jgi:hypothetical protein